MFVKRVTGVDHGFQKKNKSKKIIQVSNKFILWPQNLWLGRAGLQFPLDLPPAN